MRKEVSKKILCPHCEGEIKYVELLIDFMAEVFIDKYQENILTREKNSSVNLKKEDEMVDLNLVIANNLKTILKKKNMKRSELARESDLNNRYLHRMTINKLGS